VPPELASRAAREATANVLGRPDPLQHWALSIFGR